MWGPRHKCKNAKLFLLEEIEMVQGLQSGMQITKLEEDVDSDVVAKIAENNQTNQEEDIEITLYALIGTPTPGTMRVMGKINGSGLVILVNTSSTHNFIDASLVSSLQLRVDATIES